jgi:2-keto-4-pentenoate hydratase/2-oxohepta-3-ene-1,7-dioic acid hydratase in catechol pathway
LDYLITRYSDLKQEIDMKLASFKTGNRETYGVLAGDTLREPDDVFRASYPNLRSAIAGDKLALLEASNAGATHDVDSVQFLPLIPNPDKILCVGVNYRPHIAEMGRDVPDYPVVFVRFAGSQVGHGQAVIRPQVSEQFDFEGELAVVIGRSARHVKRSDALGYVAGYCCFMDGSVRDWQRHTMQFTPGKNFLMSGSMGPWLVTSDEVPEPKSLKLTTHVNGKLMLEGRVSDLVFDIPALIEYCSTFTELLPGDVIATGTPGGVGAARTPPAWLKDGDLITVDIPGVGSLVNSVADERRE